MRVQFKKIQWNFEIIVYILSKASEALLFLWFGATLSFKLVFFAIRDWLNSD